MPMSANRTKWPVTGGAVGVQPGWFQGHSNALIYINLGDGTVPENYSLIMQPVFGIVGPDNVAYNGSFCLPQVPLPANYTAVIGNNATIQVIEAAQHGAALFNVSCSVPVGAILDHDGLYVERPADTCGNYSVWILRLRTLKMWRRSRRIIVRILRISLSNTPTAPTVKHPMRTFSSRVKLLGWLLYLLP